MEEIWIDGRRVAGRPQYTLEEKLARVRKMIACKRNDITWNFWLGAYRSLLQSGCKSSTGGKKR